MIYLRAICNSKIAQGPVKDPTSADYEPTPFILEAALDLQNHFLSLPVKEKFWILMVPIMYVGKLDIGSNQSL